MTPSTKVGDRRDHAPGDSHEGKQDVAGNVRTQLIGIAIAAAMTAASFGAVGAEAIWAPAVPVVLVVLAIAQMGVHLVFFLHITTRPDSANNVLALAFGILVTMLIIFGSLWIMSNLDHNMMPMDEIMKRQR